ncbi:MAG: hypothetical protein AB7N76_01475 [Planctomycetota bacterium]
MTRALCLLLILAASGCKSSQLLETMDEGEAFERQGREQERAERCAEAEVLYGQSVERYTVAKQLAEDLERGLFIHHIEFKLSILSSSRGRCLQVDKNPQGSWKAATEHYKEAARIAERIGALKLQRIAVADQAYCARPDKNPEGSWKRAGALYEKAIEITKAFEDDEGRAELSRLLALCLMEGKLDGELSEEARRLLERARKLGDEEAAEILARSKTRYCPACGQVVPGQATHCPACGHDQADPLLKKHKDPEKYKLRGPGTAPPQPDGGFAPGTGPQGPNGPPR